MLRFREIESNVVTLHNWIFLLFRGSSCPISNLKRALLWILQRDHSRNSRCLPLQWRSKKTEETNDWNIAASYWTTSISTWWATSWWWWGSISLGSTKLSDNWLNAFQINLPMFLPQSSMWNDRFFVLFSLLPRWLFHIINCLFISWKFNCTSLVVFNCLFVILSSDLHVCTTFIVMNFIYVKIEKYRLKSLTSGGRQWNRFDSKIEHSEKASSRISNV